MENKNSNKIISILKKIPVDLGQADLRETTKGKLIALSLIKGGNGKNALDIGCREGLQSRWLEQKGYNVTSIDIEKSYKKCQVVDVNETLPFDDASFDLIWCSEVIEHLDAPQHAASEFRRVLKKDGEMILTTPNSYFLLMRLLYMLGTTPQKVQRDDHKHFFTETDIRRIFPNATIYGYFPYILIKRTIRCLLGALTPTFIIHETKKQ